MMKKLILPATLAIGLALMGISAGANGNDGLGPREAAK